MSSNRGLRRKSRDRFASTLIFLMLLFLSGISTASAQGLPVISNFAAIPEEINLGGSSTLSWNIVGADSASIDKGIGNVDSTAGSLTISPENTTTYTLTANNDHGPVTANVTVTVDLPPAPPANLRIITTLLESVYRTAAQQRFLRFTSDAADKSKGLSCYTVSSSGLGDFAAPDMAATMIQSPGKKPMN